jgi:hypothetical protein
MSATATSKPSLFDSEAACLLDKFAVYQAGRRF